MEDLRPVPSLSLDVLKRGKLRGAAPHACPTSALLLAGAMLLILLGTVGCRKSQEPTRQEAIVMKVVCQPAIVLRVTDFDEFVGRTEASETVEVRARLSGYLRTVDFEEGANVKKDDLLATIEPDEYQAIHDQSLARINLWQAKLELAQSSYKRAESLIKNAAISQDEFDENIAAVKEAEAAIVAAKSDAARSALDLKYTEIRAPISGRIDRAMITPGNLVTGGLGSGTMLTRIVNDTPIYAYLDVDEGSILRYVRLRRSENTNAPTDDEGKLKALRSLNIPCFLQLKDEQDFPHQGVLDFVENRVDKATGTIRIRAVFENQDRLLQGGMFVRARIPTSAPYDAVLIPEMSIGTDQSYKFAYVINESNKAERRTLTLGESRGSLRIVKSGIQAGEHVVVRGIQRVRPGMEVQPVIEPASEAPVAETSVPAISNLPTSGESAVESATEEAGK